MKTIDETAPCRISLIAAIGLRTRALGKNGRLLWQLPEDLKRFKALTSGHPVVMGRKTWESLPEKFRPLPGRANIVVTRDEQYDAPGASVAHSLDDAIATAEHAEGGEEVFVIGGGELYAAALPRADRLYLTLVDDDVEGDAFFPEYEKDFTEVIADESHNDATPPYRFIELGRGNG